MEIQIQIMEILFAEYLRTRPKEKRSQPRNPRPWDLFYGRYLELAAKDTDYSFFAARQSSPSMRLAARTVFFQHVPSDLKPKTVAAMETRIDLEEKFAAGIVQLDSYRMMPCRFCHWNRECGPGAFCSRNLKLRYDLRVGLAKGRAAVYRDYWNVTHGDSLQLFQSY